MNPNKIVRFDRKHFTSVLINNIFLNHWHSPIMKKHSPIKKHITNVGFPQDSGHLNNCLML